MTTPLHEERLAAVLEVLRDAGARTILDLGCGDGALLLRLAGLEEIKRIVGIDLQAESLEALRTALARLPAPARAKVLLIHGALTLPRPHLAGFDAAVLVETIEHIEPARLSEVERALLRDLRPGLVVLTTPNRDFNPLLGVPEHRLRHPDHRFEWGRARFRAWAAGLARRGGYDATFTDLGGAHPIHGGASQMATLRRATGGPPGGRD